MKLTQGVPLSSERGLWLHMEELMLAGYSVVITPEQIQELLDDNARLVNKANTEVRLGWKEYAKVLQKDNKDHSGGQSECEAGFSPD